MQVISINVGRRERLEGRSFNGETGIFKRPAAGPVQVDALGLASDQVVNTRNHGGPDQAVYLYRQEDYDWWSAELGRPLEPGTFGENLTVAGLPEPAAVIGSRLAFAQVVLEVTAPRIPCNTLATRMGDPHFVKRFVQAERPGIYCRVVTPGAVDTGEPFTVKDYDGEPITTIELLRAFYRKLDAGELRRFLAAPIAVRARQEFQRQLEAAAPEGPLG